MPLEKMICGENYTTELLKDNVNGLIDLSKVQKRVRSLSDTQLKSSYANSVISYEDASALNESWDDLVNWAVTTPVGVQVSSGKLYSVGANSGKNGINHGISLSASDRYRAVFKLNGKNGGSGTSGGIIFGFNTQAVGEAPAAGGGGVYGLYLRAGAPQSVLNGVFSDLNNSSDSYDRFNDYTVTLTIDEYYLSVVAVSDTDGGEIRMRHSRDGLNVNNLHIFLSDADALAGVSVEPFIGAKAVRSFGAVEVNKNMHWSGDYTSSFKFYLPNNYDSRRPLKLCIAFHGNGSDENHWTTNGNGSAIKDGLVDGGFAFLGCTYNANKATWGAQESLDAYYSAYLWVKSMYPIGSVVFYGNSMGGIESLLSIAEQRIPNIMAWVGTNPTTDLRANYSNPTFTNIINGAYGINESNPYETATLGHDPILIDNTNYYSVPFLFIAAADDDIVPPSENTDAFISKVKDISEVEKVEIPSGGHSANFQPYLPDIINFYSKYCQ